ncbi:hypothetical protein Bbelb_400880 [Branchiostoma belcheri]|nr:hypothetical protein Bbelb_400880 [Branchiostoma belcheri]
MMDDDRDMICKGNGGSPKCPSSQRSSYVLRSMPNILGETEVMLACSRFVLDLSKLRACTPSDSTTRTKTAGVTFTHLSRRACQSLYQASEATGKRRNWPNRQKLFQPLLKPGRGCTFPSSLDARLFCSQCKLTCVCVPTSLTLSHAKYSQVQRKNGLQHRAFDQLTGPRRGAELIWHKLPIELF